MNRKKTLIFAVILLFSLAAQYVYVQTMAEMEFRNQEIVDILLVLAEVGKISIIPDETVHGTASYFFSEMEFWQAFEVFLKTYDLYYVRENDVVYVSRVRCGISAEDESVRIDAVDTDIRYIIRVFSRTLGTTVLYDSLPQEEITVHLSGVSPLRALEIIMRKFPEYGIESESDHYYIRRLPREGAETARGSQDLDNRIIRNPDDSYSVFIEKLRLSELLDLLFHEAGVEYSMFMRGDLLIEGMEFDSRPFEEILPLVCERGNADFAYQDGIYYIFEIQSRDVLKQFKETVLVRLEHVPVEDIPALLPQDLASSGFYKIDVRMNTIILRGSETEIQPLKQFLINIDVPLQGRSYRRFDLSNIDASELLSVIPEHLGRNSLSVIPGTESLVGLFSDDTAEALQDYLQLVDRKLQSRTIELKYIKTEDVLEHLPPSATKDCIHESSNPSVFFFTGSDVRYYSLLDELKHIDKPKPQIRYDLLVIQYQEGNSIDWGITAENSVLEDGAKNAFLGTIGELISLNFDIVSTFGYLFSIKLNLDIGSNYAHVLADTTLNGISGEQIKFQNTNTYRYSERQADEETGELLSTGVTREITSGLIIDIEGWVSGDGVITMDVEATVSKQSSNDSDSDNIPSTSEKVVSTQVRTRSGEPVIIGGLKQQDVDKGISKIPGLGDIPIIGLLFQHRVQTLENTDMVIYIIPHVEITRAEKVPLEERLAGYYERLIQFD